MQGRGRNRVINEGERQREQKKIAVVREREKIGGKDERESK